MRVDRYFRVFHNARYPYIDVKEPQEELTELVEIDDERPFILHPGEFVLGSTLERITLPDDLVARLEGKSSLGRLGLLIHSTAGFIDPGWDGHVTLELSNVANLPITIYYAMKIGQLSFVQLTEPAETPYGSRRARLQVPGPAGPDAEPLLAELRARAGEVILVTGGTGFVGGHVVHALRAAGRPVRCLVARARRRRRRSSCELVQGDMTDRGEPARAPSRAWTRSSTWSRSARASDEKFERIMVAGHARPARGGEGSGRRALRAHERARDERGVEGPRALLRREVGDGAGRQGARASRT